MIDVQNQLRSRKVHLALRSSLLGLLLITLVESAPQSVIAQNDEKSIDCNKVAKGIGQNTYTLTVCASRENLAARSELAKTIKELHSVIRDYYKDNDGLKILEQSQASWQAWKSKEAKFCAYAYGYGYGPEGSGYEFQLNNCAAYLTDQRTKKLKEYLTEMKSR